MVLIFNFLSWQSPVIGTAFGLAYVVFYSFIFGSIFIPQKGWQLILGLFFLIAIIAIFGAFFIYFYQFNNYLFALLVFLIPLILITPYYQTHWPEKFSLIKIFKKYLDRFNERREPKTNGLLVTIYLALAIAGFLFLFKGQTTESIQSPWQVVPDLFLPVYFLATSILLVYLLRSKRTKLPLILIGLHAFLSTGVALIVYQIGYGFDPFIHQATEKIINQTGTITPKPLYYLGQYGLVIFLHKLTLINLETIDRFLVPVLSSLLLPTITFYIFSQWLKKNYALVLALAVLVIPYPSFIMTAPMNLANLFFIATILLSMLYFRNQIKVSVLYLLALATLAIHPLAGIPLLITIILLNLFKLLYTSYLKYLSLYFLAGLVFIIFLPLAFLVNGSTINLNPDLQRTDFKIVNWVNKADLPLDLAYLIKDNVVVLAGLIILIGLIYIAKNKLLKNNAGYLMAAVVIFSSYLITRYFLTFPDLRDFDSAPFVGRLLTLTFYVLLPFFLLGIHFLVKKFWEKDLSTKIFLVLILAGTITVSLYLSYPRLNQYEPAKFFSLSAADIKAVTYIEQTANPNHLVLANQMVGAAAIKEFGFKKYYNNQFYYSMPMGNPQTFYDYYLEMIYQGATRQTMEKAMAQAGVGESYFVLNQYWRNAEKIAEQAKESADIIYEIDAGKVYIFKYTIHD